MYIANIPCHVHEEFLINRIANVIKRTECDCIALSAGIDTALIAAIAVKVVKHMPKALVAYYKHGIPKDLIYAVYVAKTLGLDIEFIEINDEYVARILPIVAEIARGSGHEDYIEIRNDVVFYAVLEKAKNMCKCIYTGSGGDETFCGYSFMYSQLLESEIDEKRRVWAYGRYPEKEIAKILNVNVVMPYLDQEVLEESLTIPVRCLRTITSEGKTILRDILRSMGLNFVAERIKAPAEAGAGTEIMDKDYFNRIKSNQVGSRE